MSMYRRLSCFEDGSSPQTSPTANSAFSINKMERGGEYGSQDDTTDLSNDNDDSIRGDPAMPVANTDDLVGTDEEDFPSLLATSPSVPSKSTRFADSAAPQHSKPRRRETFSHHRVLTNTDFSFPLPEILNQNGGGTKELNELLEMTLKEVEASDIENNRPPYDANAKNSRGRRRNKSKGHKKAKGLDLIPEKKGAVNADDSDEMSLKIEEQVGSTLQEQLVARPTTDQGMDSSPGLEPRSRLTRDEQFLAGFDDVPYPQPVEAPNTLHTSESVDGAEHEKRRNSDLLHQKIQNEALKMTHKFGSRRSFQKEWFEEAAVRDMYSVVPPVQLELGEGSASNSTPTLQPMMQRALSGFRSSFQRIASPLHHDDVHEGREVPLLPRDVEREETHYL